jgi:hypothetical protein
MTNREKALEAAVRDFLDITDPSARIGFEEPDYGADVRALGERIGYGAMMASAQAAWRALLARDGLEGGEHTHGPCYAVLMDAREKALAALQTQD